MADFPFETAKQAEDWLARQGKDGHEDLDLFTGALALSAMDHVGLSLLKYWNHIEVLRREVAKTWDFDLKKGEKADVYTALKAVQHVMVELNEYHGDLENYDDLQNADIIRVIERRTGLPVALAILYIDVMRAQGWAVEGISFPAHFVIRLDLDGQRILIDPFRGGKILEASDLRNILKRVAGEYAELSAEYYEPVNSREILIRLMNNTKTRQIADEAYGDALVTIDRMLLFSPKENRLHFERGILLARRQKNDEAISALEKFIEHSEDVDEKHDAVLLIQQLESEHFT